MLVEKYKLGNTTIEIYDDAYKDKSQEDINKIIKRVEDIGRRALYRQSNQAKAKNA